MKSRRYIYILFPIIIFILFSYWLKCQLGIEFSDSIDISQYIPFSYLSRNEVIKAHKQGELISETFNRPKWLLNNWSELWMAENGKVTQAYDNSGTNNSRALLIKSKSSKSWAYSYNMFVQVNPGDKFILEGFVKVEGKEATAYIGVASFDMNKNVIDYDYIRKGVSESETRAKTEEMFTVADGIGYICLRLTGSGVGECRFDDIRLIKESPIISHQGTKNTKG